MKILVTMPINDRQKKIIEEQAPDEEYLYCPAADSTPALVADVDVILGNINPALLKEARKLKWIQLNNAGTEGFCDGALPAGTLLTNATGAYGLAISEHMIGTLFELRKKLNLYYANQINRTWKSEGHVGVIEGSTVLIIGLGDIGTAFARKMKGLGCYTIGVKRRPGNKPEGIDELYTLEKLDELLPKSDVVAMSIPGNSQTYHILSKERIALLNKNTVILNVGRGMTLDTDALVEALNAEKIAGAAVDVTDPEPLPADHPLWSAKNAIVTPHISGGFALPETLEKIVHICADNLGRYTAGKELKNIVDFETGYCK